MNSTILADSCGELCYVRKATSTQSLLRDLWLQGELSTPGAAVVTEEQTAGRGRLGRRWEAPEGTSLLASVLCAMPDASSTRKNLGWLTICAAISARWAICHALSGIADTPELDKRLLLKWPNDVVIATSAELGSSAFPPHLPSSPRLAPPSPLRKVCGVLGEYLGKRDGRIWAALGIGINIRQNEAQLATPAATSLALEYPNLAGCYSRSDLRDLLLSSYRTSLRHLNEELANDPDRAVPYLASLATSQLAQPTCAIQTDGSLEITYGEHKHWYHPDGVALAATKESAIEEIAAENL